jgi:hypothetical protein
MNYVTFIFSLIISLVAFWFSIKFIRLYFKVKRWNRVMATIISKEVILHLKSSSPRSPYGLKVEYVYQVNHIVFTGQKVDLIELEGGQTNHMKSTAEKRLTKIDNAALIYINPMDPKQAVMYCEGIGLYIFVFCMAIFSLLIGLINI